MNQKIQAIAALWLGFAGVVHGEPADGMLGPF